VVHPFVRIKIGAGAGVRPFCGPPGTSAPTKRLLIEHPWGGAHVCPPSCQPTGRHCHARQPGHFLEIALLLPPLAALRRFPRRQLPIIFLICHSEETHRADVGIRFPWACRTHKERIATSLRSSQ